MLKTCNITIKNSVIKNHRLNIKKKSNDRKVIISRKNKFYERDDPLFQSNNTLKNYIDKKLNEQNQSKEKNTSEKNSILYKTINYQKPPSRSKNIHTVTNSKIKTKEMNIIQKKNRFNKSHNKVLTKTKTLNQIKINRNNLSVTRNRIFNVSENSLKKNKTIIQKQSNSGSTAFSINENNKIKKKFNKKKLLSIYTPFGIDSLKQINRNSKSNVFNNRYNNNLITFPENIFDDLLEEKKPIDECPIPTPYVKKYCIETGQEIINNKKNNNCIKNNVKKNTLVRSSTTANYNFKKKSINKNSQDKSNSNKNVRNDKNKILNNRIKNLDKYKKSADFNNSNLNKITKKKNCLENTIK